MKKKMLIILIFALFIITGGAAFPIYNFTKAYEASLTFLSLFVPFACYGELGIFEKSFLKQWNVFQIALLNLSLIFIGMFCRYLLEFGEVSNTYNFTPLNVVVHVVVTFVISMLSYILAKGKELQI